MFSSLYNVIVCFNYNNIYYKFKSYYLLFVFNLINDYSEY